MFRRFTNDGPVSVRVAAAPPDARLHIVAVTTLALGIAANTAFFSIVNALVLKPLPGVDLTGVSLVWKGSAALTLDELRGLETDLPDSIGDIAGSAVAWGARIQIPGRVEETRPELVTGAYARMLRLSAQQGRWIGPEDDRAPSGEAVAVISDRLWREWYGARADVAGRELIRVKVGYGPGTSQVFTIIGVASPAFRGLQGRFEQRDIWIPAAAAARFLPGSVDREKWRLFLNLTTAVRPAPGGSIAAVAGALQSRLAPRESAAAKPPPRVRVVPASDVMSGWQILQLSGTVLGLAILVLLAACANLANMLYARGANRAAEMAVRLSLGASRAQLVRLLFAEVGIIAALGATLGLGLAIAVTSLFKDAFPYLLAGRYGGFALDLTPDLRVLAFAFIAGALSAALVGAVTAWRVGRAPLLQTLAGSGAPAGMTARGHRLRAALVTVQVTVAVILVMVGGFAWESLRQTLDREGNFGRRVHYDVERLSTVKVDLRYHGYNEVRARQFLTQVVDELRQVSGIERVALGDILPGGCTPGAPLTASCRTLVTARDRDGFQSTARRVNVTLARASAGYLETTGLALMRGRDFNATDAEGAPRVAIVSERVAERLWPGENPLGQPLMLAARDIATVVGVSADPVSAAGNSALPQSHFVMIPFAQWPAMAMRIVVRTQATDGHLETVRAAIRRLDDDVAVLEAAWAQNASLSWVKPQQAAMLLVISLGSLALGISMLGVYGVIAYSVSTRIREFGIRLALGSTRRGVVKLVLDQAIHVTLIGLLVGVFVVTIASSVIQSRQFDFMPERDRDLGDRSVADSRRRDDRRRGACRAGGTRQSQRRAEKPVRAQTTRRWARRTRRNLNKKSSSRIAVFFVAFVLRFVSMLSVGDGRWDERSCVATKTVASMGAEAAHEIAHDDRACHGRAVHADPLRAIRIRGAGERAVDRTARAGRGAGHTAADQWRRRRPRRRVGAGRVDLRVSNRRRGLLRRETGERQREPATEAVPAIGAERRVVVRHDSTGVVSQQQGARPHPLRSAGARVRDKELRDRLRGRSVHHRRDAQQPGVLGAEGDADVAGDGQRADRALALSAVPT